jgi:hypothetical protein
MRDVDLGRLKQLGSLTRAALLFRIPDDRAMTLRRLVRECAPTIAEQSVIEHTTRLVADGFVRCTGDCLQRVNGWVPLHKQLLAVELKLRRVEEAMYQALNNLAFADQSYIGLPKDLALRVAAKGSRWTSFLEQGVGVLAVTSRDCFIVMHSKDRSSILDPVIQFHCVEKLWRSSAKDN